MPPNLQNRFKYNNSSSFPESLAAPPPENPAEATLKNSPSTSSPIDSEALNSSRLPRSQRPTPQSRGRKRRSPWVQAPPSRQPVPGQPDFRSGFRSGFRSSQPSASRDRASAPLEPNDPLSEDAWSPSVEAVLDQPSSRLPQILLIGGVVFMASLGIWSWYGKFDQIGYAAGKLIPQGELYKVHSAEAGKIISLSVKEGDQINEGDLIAVLNNDLAKGEVERLQQVIQTAKLQFTQQQQLLEQLKLEVKSRQYVSDAEIQAQQIAIGKAAQQIQTSMGLLMQSQGDLIGYQERLARIEPLVTEGAIARERLFEIEQQMRDRQSSVIQNQGSVAQAQNEVKQLQAVLQQRVAEGQRSQLASQQQVQNLLLQITELQGRLQENETLMKTAQSRLQQYFLYAPVSGVVASLSIKNPGEVIQPGQTLMEMRSGDDPLVLEASITSRESGFVKVGMPVKVKFDAYPYQKFGVIPGKVVFTSPDSKTDPQSGITAYRIKVKLERHHIVSEKEKVQFRAGQTATAEIIVRRRRIIDTVLEPIRQLRASGNGS
jgi:hemolysin D